MKNTQSFPRGAASLLTTVVLSVLLLGVVSGLTALSINELRQAADVEQSSRALVAAESYIDELSQTMNTETGSHERRACNAAPASPDTAKDPIGFGNNSYITCALVRTADSEETIGVVGRDQTYRLDLSKAYQKSAPATILPVTHMSIEWATGEDDGAGDNPILSGYPILTSSNWASPAALELTYTGWNNSGLITPTNSGDDYGMKMKKLVFTPSSNGGGIPPNTCDATLPAAVGAYRCRTTATAAGGGVDKFDLNSLTGFSPSSGLVFKLTARYAGTHFRLKFYNNGNLLTVPQAYAILDVTARSSNLYRRVIAQKPLTLESPIEYLDNVIFSGKNICKDMKLHEDHTPAQYEDGTPVPNGGKNSSDCETPVVTP